jgi:hypothetical protein
MPYAQQVKNPHFYRSDRLTEAVGLGDLWDTIGKIAGTVQKVAGTVQQVSPYARDVVSGNSAITVVPTNRTSTVVSGSGPIAIPVAGMPSWVIPVGLGAVALLLLSRRR